MAVKMAAMRNQILKKRYVHAPFLFSSSRFWFARLFIPSNFDAICCDRLTDKCFHLKSKCETNLRLRVCTCVCDWRVSELISYLFLVKNDKKKQLILVCKFFSLIWLSGNGCVCKWVSDENNVPSMRHQILLIFLFVWLNGLFLAMLIENTRTKYHVENGIRNITTRSIVSELVQLYFFFFWSFVRVYIFLSNFLLRISCSILFDGREILYWSKNKPYLGILFTWYAFERNK